MKKGQSSDFLFWKKFPLKFLLFPTLFIIFLIFLFGCSTQTALATQNSLLQMNDWMALGSGCRGREHGQGDVRLELLPLGPGLLDFQIKIDLGSYQLDGNVPVRPNRPTFARECAIRLALTPTLGYRIKNLSLQSSLSVTKQQQSELQLFIRMLTGSSQLSLWQHEFEKSKSIDDQKIKINLAPDWFGMVSMQEIPCSAPKIVGIDFSFINKRGDFTSTVNVIPFERSTTLYISLEKCQL